MEKRELNPVVMFGVIVVVALVAIFLGWRYMNGPRTGPGGVDLPSSAQQPANMSYGPGGGQKK